MEDNQANITESPVEIIRVPGSIRPGFADEPATFTYQGILFTYKYYRVKRNSLKIVIIFTGTYLAAFFIISFILIIKYFVTKMEIQDTSWIV